MKLKQLLKGIAHLDIRGNKDLEITGIASDSRVVAPGNLFIARKGEKYDGSHFLGAAVQAGAKAVVTDVYDPFLKATQIIVSNPKMIESIFAAQYFERPSKKLFCVGITGTKGKTTSCYLVRHMLENLGESCGLFSTIETLFGQHSYPATSTTRDAVSNQKFLHAMVNEKCKAAVLEVSSHGLEQGRVCEIDFDAAVFTNFYPDHLDYHKTVENYLAAKQKLFTSLKGISVLNADSPWSQFMKGGKKTISFGVENKADIFAKEIILNESGIAFSIENVRFTSPLFGLFNVYNMLGAIGVGLARGKSLEEMSLKLASFPGVPGRLQRVQNSRGLHVFVDYAHNGESLASVLSYLRAVASKKIFVVFGCGGDRDPNRRKEMAQAAEQFADVAIVTTDNPRSEDPKAICAQILQGFKNLSQAIVEIDRKNAIAKAISLANPGDFILIAGKGHEKVQIFLDKTVTFDDVAIAEEMLQL